MVRLDNEMIEESKELLKAMGIPVVQAFWRGRGRGSLSL